MIYAIGCFPDDAGARAAAKALCADRERREPIQLYAHASRSLDFGGLVDPEQGDLVSHAYPDSENPTWVADMLLPFQEAIRRGGTVVVVPEADQTLAEADVQRMQALGAAWPEDPAIGEMDPKLAARLFPHHENTFLNTSRGQRFAHVGSEHGVIDVSTDR